MSKSKTARAARCFLWAAVSCAFVITTNVAARPGSLTCKIVGPGAATCQRFNADIAMDPSNRRDYRAWAQGYMSAILLGRPVGVDDSLDLVPPTFGLPDQLKFLEDFCVSNVTMDFSDAVEALYKRLRQEGKM
jgi:hypothetical protein